MAAGLSSYFELDSTLSTFKIRVNWSEEYNASKNSSTVTITSVQIKSTKNINSYFPDGTIKVNGKAVITMNSELGDHYCDVSVLNEWLSIKNSSSKATASGSTTVVHEEDGKKSIQIEVVGNRFDKCKFYTANGAGGSGWGCTGSNSIALTAIPTYILTISSGTGSTIAVSRTASGYAGTGSIKSGTRLYYGDKLKISFSPNKNYMLLTTAVNNSKFTSGNTHTVTSNVSVTSTAQVLSSSVGATDAKIGSTSTITVTKYNASYYHSLQYSFGSLSGYITSSGGVQQSEAKINGSSIAFSVPDVFYAQIPNAKTGVCTITCRTYSSQASTTVLGSATSCTFTVTAASEKCSPVLSVSVSDTNPTTKALTGDESYLIKYMSTAKCTISASRRYSATISSMSINDVGVTGTTSGDVTTATKTFTLNDSESFKFSATDSRGYTTTKTLSPTVIKYTKLTCNPVIARSTPTGGSIVMTFTGNFYRGSFGAYSNTLLLRYRYKEAGGSYGSWNDVSAGNIVFGTASYRSKYAISLGDNFDYRKSYDFQVQAVDGTGDFPLSTVTVSVPVQRGLSVFDWGENDFNFNVPIVIGSGIAGEENGVCKKFTNGIWVGNDAPQNESGVFSPKQGYNGIFINTENSKTYVVEGTSMRELYTGDTIAKFG